MDNGLQPCFPDRITVEMTVLSMWGQASAVDSATTCTIPPRRFKSLSSKVLSGALIFATLYLTGCAISRPSYSRPVVRSNNGVQTFNKPKFEGHVTWFGWLSYLAMTGAGAYGGYVSGVALPWDSTGVATVKPVGNAVLGGLAGFVLNGIITAVFASGNNADVTVLTAQKWLNKVDEDLRYIPIVADSNAKLDAISGLPLTSEATFVMHSSADARLFATMFPNSSFELEVVRRSVDSLSTEELPRVLDLIKSSASRDIISEACVRRSPTFQKLLESFKRFPEHREVVEERGAELVDSYEDVMLYEELFPGSSRLPTLLARIAERIPVRQIDSFVRRYPNTVQSAELKERLVDSCVSVHALARLLKDHPDQRSNAESKMFRMASTADEYDTYLNEYPRGIHAREARHRRDSLAREPENLGPAINTRYSEIAPVISPDGRTLYFDRKYSPDNTGGSDDGDEIWVSTVDANGRWQKARQIGPPLNRYSPDNVNAVTPDGNTLLVGSYQGTSIAALTHRTKEGWSDPVDLDMKDYYNTSDYYGVFLSNDGKTLLMSVQRADSRGERDLYVSFVQPDSTWSAPRSLGPIINTKEDEDAPFLASDGVTLYFSSAGHGGFGGRDIFMSRRLDDTWRKWSKPANIGEPINSSGAESFLYLPASGVFAYYTSNSGGYGRVDIYRVGLAPEYLPRPVVLISGTVLDKKTGLPLAASISYEDLATGKEIGRARSDPKTGSYKIALPSGIVYGFQARAAGYVAISDNVDLTQLREYEEREANLFLVPLEAGQTIRLNNLFFDFGQATLRKESLSELNRLAELMRENPSVRIEIHGHTDSVGTEERNKDLSSRRATAVQSYLATHQIAAERAVARGFGATKPLADNGTENGRRQNRRVEIVIVER